MKQNTYNKGRNKKNNPKIKNLMSKPQKKGVDKKEMIEETLDQRLNRVIENNKAISELIIGYIPYTIKFIAQSYKGVTNKPEKISAFEKAVVGIISIDGQTSLSNIGKILGLDIEHDIAEQKMIRSAIDTMIRYNLVRGDESAYFITEQGKEFAAHGERMKSFSSDFELWYLNRNHSFTRLRDCILADDIQLVDESDFFKENESLLPLTFEEIKALSEIQASNMQSSKERFILQEATPQNHNFYKYDLTVCFVQSIRTKQVRTIVYDDTTQAVLQPLSQLIEEDVDLKQTLFSQMLQAASESDGLAIYDDFEIAKSDPLVKEDIKNIISAEKRLIEQENKQTISDVKNEESKTTNSEDLSERLHKRALYDCIAFESELHNIFLTDLPDEIWLSSPWVSDRTFMRNRLPLIKNYLKKGGKVFISYSVPDGGLNSHKDKMVENQSQKALESLESEYVKQFFHAELPAFHKKNVIEVKNGQCVLFTGSFNVLSFSVTSKNITHVRAEEMCLVHYQAAINQYQLSKKLFAEKYIEKALQEISTLSSNEIQNYHNDKIEYFRKDDKLEELFIDYDNMLEERKTQAKSDILAKKIESLKSEIESKINDGLSQKEINSYRAKLFKLSSFCDTLLINDDIQNEIIHLQNRVNMSIKKPKINGNEYGNQSITNAQSVDGNQTLAMSFYELNPTDSASILKHLVGLFYLSLYNNASKANVGDKWKEKLVALLSDSNLLKFFKYNISKDKEEGTSRVYIAIDGKMFSFYNVKLGNKLVRQLLSSKTFLDKNDYQNPSVIISKLLHSL